MGSPFFTVSFVLRLCPLLLPRFLATLRIVSTVSGAINPFRAWLCRCLLRFPSTLPQTGHNTLAWCDRLLPSLPLDVVAAEVVVAEVMVAEAVTLASLAFLAGGLRVGLGLVFLHFFFSSLIFFVGFLGCLEDEAALIVG